MLGRLVECGRWLASFVGLIALSGCVASVEVSFDSCTFEGESLIPGQIVTLADGCTTCTCAGSDGLVDCSSSGCGCTAPDGSALQEGEGWSDGCGECVCSAGELGCTGFDCPCESVPPPCDDPGPGCTSTPFCDGLDWYCETVCDPCAPRLMPLCPDGPPDCSGGGAFCDPTFGWFCEAPVCPCDGATVPECFPSFEGCESVAVCDAMFDEYYCQDFCVCDQSPMPYCGPVAQPACDVIEGDWGCTSFSGTCGPDAPTCGTMSMDCVGFPLCEPNGTWVCAEECSACDPTEMPVCPPEQPNCVEFTFCGPSGFVCELICP
jgi:hypothetical protein